MENERLASLLFFLLRLRSCPLSSLPHRIKLARQAMAASHSPAVPLAALPPTTSARPRLHRGGEPRVRALDPPLLLLQPDIAPPRSRGRACLCWCRGRDGRVGLWTRHRQHRPCWPLAAPDPSCTHEFHSGTSTHA